MKKNSPSFFSMPSIKRFLFRNRLLRFFVVETGVLMISIFIVVAIGVMFGSVAGYIYDLNHAIPDYAIRGDDLGAGLIVVAAMIGSLLISLPVAVLIHIYAFKKFF